MTTSMGFPSYRSPWPSFTLQFLKLSGANILSNLMVPLASLVDTAFLGHLSEIHHLGGVALATILFNYLYWSFGFLRMGTTGLTAQAVGRGDSEGIWLLLGRNGLMALTIGMAILLLQWPIQALGFALLSASDGVTASGLAFYGGRIWGAPAVLLNFVLLGWLLGQGRGRAVLLLAAVANGANVVLDYGFVVQLGWASFGAGLATALSQYLTVAVGLAIIWQTWQRAKADLPWGLPRAVPVGSDAEVRHGAWQQLWDWSALQGLFALNRDILIRTFALVTAFSLFTNFSSALGEQQLAANTLLLQVISLAAYFIDGLAFATETFAGRFAGQAKHHGAIPGRQLQELLKFGLSLSGILGVAFALAFIAFPQLFGLLTSHGAVLAQVERSSRWLLPVMGIGSLAYLLDGYFLGLTAGQLLRNASVASTGIFFLPLALLAWQVESNELLWLALSSLMVGRVITLGWSLRKT